MVEYLRGGYGVSERRGCMVIRLHRGTYRYQSHKDPQIELRMRMREIAAVRVRYGYRKILVLLQREGWAVVTSGARCSSTTVCNILSISGRSFS